MEKPKTIQGVVDALWYVVVGMNGDGLVDMVKGLTHDMTTLKAKVPTLWTRADQERECRDDELRENQRYRARSQEKRSREVTVREWVTIVIALLAVIVAGIALVVRR